MKNYDFGTKFFEHGITGKQVLGFGVFQARDILGINTVKQWTNFLTKLEEIDYGDIRRFSQRADVRGQTLSTNPPVNSLDIFDHFVIPWSLLQPQMLDDSTVMRSTMCFGRISKVFVVDSSIVGKKQLQFLKFLNRRKTSYP